MDPYLGCVIIFGGNFAMKGFATCDGQLLSISQNTALFSILGTFYGGNGQSTFGLPDLRGRTAIQQGQGPGLTDYVIGEQVGIPSVTLLSSNIPQHSHMVNAVTSIDATAAIAPTNALFAEGTKAGGLGGKSPFYYITGTAANTTLNPLSISTNVGGGSNPVNVMQPYLAITHVIAMVGIFPSRN
jgi:microcystin-dependent protein